MQLIYNILQLANGNLYYAYYKLKAIYYKKKKERKIPNLRSEMHFFLHN